MADNRVRILATLEDKVSSGLDKIHDRFQVLGKSKGFQSVIQGVGLGAGISAYGMLQSAVGAVNDVIGDSIQMAIKDEASRGRLDTALRNNIASWDGSTAAIEKTISARMRLGFTDEEQRDSLSRLVAVYHDANQALDIQATAMDLARFKQISLEDATQSLINIEGGRYRQLGQLIGSTKDIKNATQAMAAVQRVAGDAAENAARKNEGRLLASQIKVDEATERFGYVIMPGVIDALTVAADSVVYYADALTGLTRITEMSGEEQQNLGATLLDIASRGIPPLWLALRGIEFAEDKLGLAAKNTSDIVQEDTEAMRGRVGTSLSQMESDLEDAGTAAVDFRDTFRDATGAIIRSSTKVRSALAKDAQGMIDDYFDPLEGAADLWDIRMQLLADKEALRKAKTTADSQRAKNAIVQDLDDEATKLAELGDAGVLTQGQIDQFERDAKANYASLSKDAQTKIDAIIARLRVLQGIKSINTTFTLTPSITTKGRGTATLGLHGHIEGDFDKGGTVPGPRGSPQLIVAHGGEYVVPNSETGGLRGPAVTTAGSMAPVIINLQVDGRTLARVVDERLYWDLQRAAPSRGR